MKENKLPLLRVSENRRYLETVDGEPFFWLGDTAWELFHRLNMADAATYLDCRAEQGFNVIQAVALAEHEGITVPNAYGQLPLNKNDQGLYDPSLPACKPGVEETAEPGMPEYTYWAHMDAIIKMAGERGLYIGLLPTWGDKYNVMWGKGPDVFTPENARQFGRWMGTRYANVSNIIWILGGDRPLKTRRHHAIITAMAEGIREGDGGKHLITFHPSGESSSSEYVHDETWLDFNMIQTGHGRQHLESWKFIGTDYERLPVKPTLDGEPRYEDHPVGFKPIQGFFDAADVRQATWWSVLAGGCGVTYGHHSIWSMTTEPQTYFPLTWHQALRRPGASQMHHLKDLMLSRPMLERVPDQALIVSQYEGAGHIQAARGKDHAFLYTPLGLPIAVRLGVLDWKQVKASWFNPRTGSFEDIGVYDNQGERQFRPSMGGRGEDWVLVLDGIKA